MQDVTAAWLRLARDAPSTRPTSIGRPLGEILCRSGLRTVGIAGAPGAGKSTVARAAADELRRRGEDPLVLSLDDYYLSKAARAQRGIEMRGPPGTHDIVAFMETLDAIASGRPPIVVQRFSPELDEQIGSVTLDRVPTHVLMEGWVLGHRADGYEQILDRLDLLVFVDVDVETAKRRRFEREAQLRERGGGFSEEDMNRFWDERIAPGLSLWVADARRDADVILQLRPDGALRRATTSSPIIAAAVQS